MHDVAAIDFAVLVLRALFLVSSLGNDMQVALFVAVPRDPAILMEFISCLLRLPTASLRLSREQLSVRLLLRSRFRKRSAMWIA